MTTHSDGADGTGDGRRDGGRDGTGDGGRDDRDPWRGDGGDGDGHAGEDDVLAVLLRPTGDFFPAPPGRYAAIRRGAARRRLLRAAAGAAVTCAVAVLVALPLRHAAAGRGPAQPLVPPAAPASRTAPPARQDPTPYPRPTATPRDGTHGPAPADTRRGDDRATGRPTATYPSAIGQRPSPTADPGRRVVPRTSASQPPSPAPTTAPAGPSSTPSSTASATARPTEPVRASPAQTARRSG